MSCKSGPERDRLRKEYLSTWREYCGAETVRDRVHALVVAVVIPYEVHGRNVGVVAAEVAVPDFSKVPLHIFRVR